MNKKLLSILCLLTLSGCSFAPTSSSSEISSSNEVNSSSSLTINDILGGTGDAYDPYLVGEGAYNATISTNNELVYYGFRPTRPGKYVIESLCNLEGVNPNAGYYGNNPQYVPESPINDMYNDDANGVNFKLEFNISIEEFINTGEFDSDGNLIYQYDENGNLIPGGAYVFGISATGVSTPAVFPFQITWLEDYKIERIPAENVAVTSTLSQFPEGLEDNIYVSAPIDGTLTVVYNETDGFYHVDTKDGYVLTAKISVPCTPYLDKAFSKYNEETGYWHLYDNETNTYGPILCAKITAPCPYYDPEGALSMIESHGNKNLTVSNLTENYKQFIEVEYASICNSDGVCYVTNELKEFLQKFSVSQRLFFDGNGFVESTGVYAIEEDQWLFACGWYQAK